MMNNKYSTRRLEAIRTTAKAFQYISHIYDLEPGPVVLYLRVSAPTQKDDLPHQRINLEMEVEKRGFTVIAVFEETASGWMDHRTGFGLAILKGRAANAVLVAESLNRFWRCWRYRSERKMPPLNIFEIKRLMAEADGVQLATLFHPDTPPKKEHGQQTKRGQVGKGNYGGRPVERFPKKARRLAKKPKAIASRKEGFSYRCISRQLNIPWSTIRDWTEGIQKKLHILRPVTEHTL